MPSIRVGNVSNETAQAVIRLLASREPLVPVQVREVDETWTPARADLFLTCLSAPKSRQLVEDVVASAGRVLADDLREQGRPLRGLIGPLTRTLNQLNSKGTLPFGLPVPLKIEYDRLHPTYQRAIAIIMPHDVRGPFEKALRRLT